jgi:membrane protein required for colicin V production
MFIDIIFAIIIVIACIKGFQKGLIIAVFSVLAFVIGLAAALKLSAVVANYLDGSLNVSAKWLPVLSFALVFLGVVLLVRMGAKLVEKTFQMALLGWVNRVGGMVLYAALYIVIFSIFLFYAEKIKLVDPEVIKASATYSFVQPWGPAVIDNFGKIIPIFKDTFADLEKFFGGIGNQVPK